jgi:FkbM family methyltransferase
MKAEARKAQPWPTPPRYDVATVAKIREIAGEWSTFPVAELDLDGRIVRYGVGSTPCRWRVDTLFTKEPGTIDWLHSFTPGDVFVDVGANIGLYSLYAGVIGKAQVYAFEPEAQNYVELCRNVMLNGADGDVAAYCAAITDRETEFSRLLLSALGPGLSEHDFGEPSRPRAGKPGPSQGCIGFSLDYLVESKAVPEPDHVKIDVDGHEGKVVKGMARLIARGVPRTLLLECDAALPATGAMVADFLGKGWRVNPDQLRLSREGLRPAGSVVDELKRGAYTGNVVFARHDRDLEFATRALERYSDADLERMRRDT